MQRRIIVAFGMSLILLVGIIYVAAAAYTGPNRIETRTLWERRNCHYQAVYDPPGPGSYGCYLDQYIAPSSGCPSPSVMADYFNPAVCTSWPGSCTDLPCSISGSTSVGPCVSGQLGCVSRVEEYSLPEASISGVSTCGFPGINGWCRGSAILALSASEPLPGYHIIGIEGSAGMLCDGAACDWSFPEGENVLSFWALSSYGDTSRAGLVSLAVDTEAPRALLEVSSALLPLNGWYRDPDALLAVVSAEDDTSGVASLEVQFNGAGWLPSPAEFPGEGAHTLTGRAVDKAGNETFTAPQLIRIDINSPIITISKNHIPEAPNWYTSPVEINATATDALSGLDTLAATLETSAGVEQGIPLPVTLTTEGVNTLSLIARDLAGNEAELSEEFSLDLTPPVIQDSVTGTAGQNDWYRSPISVHFQAEDATSGVESILLQNPDGSSSPASDLIFIDDGIYPVSLHALDRARWDTFADFSYKIDQTPPSVAAVLSGTLTSSNWYTSPVNIRLDAVDSISGIAEISPGVETTLSESGIFPLSWTVSDVAGNQTQYTLAQPIKIDLDPPRLEIDPLSAELQGTILLSGSASDSTSGLSRLLLSTNGGHTFFEILPGGDGNWSYSWDTASSPAGTDALILRGVDSAGNQGELEQQISITNILPGVDSALPTLQPPLALQISSWPPAFTATMLPTRTGTPVDSLRPTPALEPTPRAASLSQKSATSEIEAGQATHQNPSVVPVLIFYLIMLFLFLSDPRRPALKRLAAALLLFVQSHQKESHD